MSSLPSGSPAAGASTPWKAVLNTFLDSRWTFVGLQGLDLLTTMAAFRLGAYEINPLVAYLTVIFGQFRGVLISKLIAVAIAMGVRKLIWVVNVFYVMIILWNSLNLLGGPVK
jgi:hypothetical protein